MPGTIYTPTLTVQINGGTVGTAISARAESSFSDPTSRGYATFSGEPGWDHGDELSLIMGSGENHVLRFRGTIQQADYSNGDGTVTLVAKGPLAGLQKYKCRYSKGLGIIELTGGPATDEQIVQGVLDMAGFSGTIGGTGIARGELAPQAYRWKFGESAFDYIQRLDKASLGYRLIETIGGDIYRTQVYGRPRGGSDYSFTEGVDIYEGVSTSRSTFERYTNVVVRGFDYGDTPDPARAAKTGYTEEGAVQYPFEGDEEAYAYSSDMIEKAVESGTGLGISCELVREYVLAEVDREVVRVSGLSTPRDVLIGPGQTHAINSLLAGVQEPLWVMGVSVEVNEREFIQTMTYVGGGLADGGYEGP